MYVCVCVHVRSIHAQEPGTSQAQTQCSENKGLQIGRCIFPARQLPRATEHLGTEWISQEVRPLRAAAAHTIEIVKKQPESGEIGFKY